MRTDQARPFPRAPLAILALAAAAAASAQPAAPLPTQRPTATPMQAPPNPYAHNEQGNFRTCAADDAASPTTPPPPCRSDWDDNGAIDSRDVSAFVQAWIADTAAGTTAADFNDDGVITSADLSAFLSTWTTETAGGC